MLYPTMISCHSQVRSDLYQLGNGGCRGMSSTGATGVAVLGLFSDFSFVCSQFGY